MISSSPVSFWGDKRVYCFKSQLMSRKHGSFWGDLNFRYWLGSSTGCYWMFNENNATGQHLYAFVVMIPSKI